MTRRNKIINTIPFFIFLIGCSITLYLYSYFKDLYREKEKEMLSGLSQETEKIIRSRLKTYEDIHFSGGALYQAFGEIKYEQWKKWVEANRLLSIYPGIRGIGIAVPVNQQDSLTFLQEMRKEIPGYEISSFGQIENEPQRFIIKYIEPVSSNRRAFGFDMGSERDRRYQMNKAMLTGLTTMTGKVAIVQDIEQRPAFLMYVPVYKNGGYPRVKDVRKEFRCWIYSAFVVSEFMDGLLKDDLKNVIPYISFEIYSNPINQKPSLLYSYNQSVDDGSNIKITRNVNFYGQAWTMKFKASSNLRQLIVTKQPLIILLIGILLSLAIAWLIYSLIHKKSEAEKIARDMTKELSALNHFYESLIQSMNEGLLVLDSDLRIINANNRFYKLFRKDIHVEGKLISELTNPTWTNVLEDVRMAFNTKRVFENEYQFEFQDGTRTVFLITYCPITIDGNTEKRILLVIADITDKKENEARRNDFIGFVTHELRTPISNLKAYSQLADRYIKEKKCEETQHVNQKIETFIETLNNLVAELHDLTKITAGKLQVHKNEFNYDDFIDEIVTNAKVTYPKYKFVKEAVTVGMINADRFRIGQVLTNYISNAVKYSPGKDSITVCVKISDNTVITSVKDFGIGLSEKECNHVFDRLYRVPKAGSTEGLGLGLFLSREIIKAHDGKVWVESSEGKGSEFFYSLPCRS